MLSLHHPYLKVPQTWIHSLYIKFSVRVCGPGGGGYMTCGLTGVCRPVFRKVPSSNYLITETCGHTHLYDEFWRKTIHFLLFFAKFWITHPCLWKICRKRDPCLENLGHKNPPIWAAHTRTLNMLCTPPGVCGSY